MCTGDPRTRPPKGVVPEGGSDTTARLFSSRSCLQGNGSSARSRLSLQTAQLRGRDLLPATQVGSATQVGLALVQTAALVGCRGCCAPGRGLLERFQGSGLGVTSETTRPAVSSGHRYHLGWGGAFKTASTQSLGNIDSIMGLGWRGVGCIPGHFSVTTTSICHLADGQLSFAVAIVLRARARCFSKQTKCVISPTLTTTLHGGHCDLH